MTTNTMGRDEAGKAIRKRAMEGCPLARELLVLRGMCACQGDEKSVDDAEDRYLELAVLRDAVPALHAEIERLRAEVERLRADRGSREQQPAATSETVNVIGMPEFDGLLDHIYEHGTAAEGVIEKANAFARAVIARYAPQQPEVKLKRTVTYVCPVCAASLERIE